MNKYTLITGATKGIGLELTKLAATSGQNLILISRNESDLSQLKQTLENSYPNLKIYTLESNLNNPTSPQTIFNYTQKHNLEISELINNAGFGDLNEFKNAEWEKLESMINTNILSLTHLTHLFLPQMLARKFGKILNVASVAAYFPGPKMATYYATKAYVLSFSLALSEELAGSGVSVTALCPGPTKTNFAKTAIAEKLNFFKKNTSSPEFIAKAGYKALKNRQTISIPTLKFKFLTKLSVLLPKTTAAKIIKRFHN